MEKQKIINNLLNAIDKNYKTIVDFSKDTGIPETTISNIRNKKILPLLETFIKIAEKLNIDANELLELQFKNNYDLMKSELSQIKFENETLKKENYELMKRLLNLENK